MDLGLPMGTIFSDKMSHGHHGTRTAMRRRYWLHRFTGQSVPRLVGVRYDDDHQNWIRSIIIHCSKYILLHFIVVLLNHTHTVYYIMHMCVYFSWLYAYIHIYVHAYMHTWSYMHRCIDSYAYIYMYIYR